MAQSPIALTPIIAGIEGMQEDKPTHESTESLGIESNLDKGPTTEPSQASQMTNRIAELP